jgi:hypothetical protein
MKGLILDVNVSKDGKYNTKQLKVCTIKVRSITFIEVDRVNRKNIFRKVNLNDIISFDDGAKSSITLRDSVLPDRWESGWDGIGTVSPSVGNSFGRRAFSNHSKGWAPTIKRPMGSVMDALAANPLWKKSTTNSAAGFPMV